jgi:hypothetical protein
MKNKFEQHLLDIKDLLKRMEKNTTKLRNKYLKKDNSTCEMKED